MTIDLRRVLVRRAASLAARLGKLGHTSLASYVLGITIGAAYTKEDVTAIVEEVLPAQSGSSIALWSDPEGSYALREITRDLLRFELPEAAVQVYCTVGPLPHWQSPRSILLQWHRPNTRMEAERSLSWFGDAILDAGRSEGLRLFGLATLQIHARDPLAEIAKRVYQMSEHPAPALPPAFLKDISSVARELAVAGRFPSAVGLGLLVPALTGRSSIDSGGELVEVALREKATSRPFPTEVARRVAPLSQELLHRGYPAEAAELSQLAINLPLAANQAWAPVWRVLDRRIGEIVPAAEPPLRSWAKPLAALLTPRRRRLPLEKVLTEVVAAQTPQIKVREPHGQDKFEPLSLESHAPRRINSWLEGAEPPLKVGEAYQIGVNIGAPREDNLASVDFQEPSWRGRTKLELLITLTGAGVDVTPSWHTAILPHVGEMEPVVFEVTPRVAGDLRLYVSFFTARELTLLEELQLSLKVVEAPVLATA